jgi:hypothetical protein
MMSRRIVGFCTGLRKERKFPVLAHGEVAEGQHQAGHGERQHREEIEHLAAGDLGAHDHVGDGDAEHDVDDGGEARVLEAVGDGRNREVVAQRERKLSR